MKLCACCKETKELSEFSKHKQKPDGLYNYCRLCKKIKDKETYEKYKDARYEKTREYVAKNPEKVKAYKKKWQDNNKHVNEAWRKANPEKVKEYAKRTRQRCAASKNADTRFRQARQLQATPPWADREEMKAKYRLAKFFTDLSGGFVKYHVDHIVPLRGETVCGLHVTENLQVLRSDLNYLKNNKFTVGEENG